MRRRALLPLLVLSGCAPLAEMRPASGIMEGKTFEAGAAAVHVGTRPYVTTDSPSNTGLAWFSGKVSKRVTLSGVTAIDYGQDSSQTSPSLKAAVGGAFRYDILKHDRFVGGAELQAGYAWGALVLPVAVRLFDQTWLYANPRLGNYGRYLSFFAPAGLSVRVYDGLMLRAEAQVSWEDFQYYNRRFHYAGGVAYQF